MFYPEDARVPAELRTDEFLLQPLRTIHVELDYDALMTSKEMLRKWSQSGWPADDFTLEDNLKDLKRHEQEHFERTAFTFTVLDPSQGECLGCVYISPLLPILWDVNVCGKGVVEAKDYVAYVRFWVRQSRLADELDRRLLGVLKEWFEQQWAFTCVVFRAAKGDERQERLFVEAGLGLRGEFPSQSAKWAIYSS